ncbi:hypothetical protein BLOT_015724 [Blomia tropicalis]|nr:hypothetical protein BLOT_015724 [Blomia tropicalis]
MSRSHCNGNNDEFKHRIRHIELYQSLQSNQIECIECLHRMQHLNNRTLVVLVIVGINSNSPAQNWGKRERLENGSLYFLETLIPFVKLRRSELIVYIRLVDSLFSKTRLLV